MFPAGTTNCSGPVPGRRGRLREAIDNNSSALDAGQGLAGLPGSILQMTGNPLDVINPANLPVNPATCKPIYPNQYLQVNTIFNVARAARAAHRLVGQAPRVPDVQRALGHRASRTSSPPRSTAMRRPPAGDDWTSDNAADHAVRLVQGAGDPERDRRLRPQRHAPRGRAGHLRDELPDRLHRPEAAHLRRPDRRLPARRHGSRPAAGRARSTTSTPRSAAWCPGSGPHGLAGSTAIIISAKHGQSPTDPNALARVPDSPIISAINAAWKAAHPGARRPGHLLHRR